MHTVTSGGYYGICFIERFHRYRSKKILELAFSNMQDIFIYFWPHFEKPDGRHRRFSTFSKDIWWPSRTKGIIGRDLKFTGYVPHKIFTGNIFGLMLKNMMAATGVSLSVIKSAYISLIIGPRVLGW